MCNEADLRDILGGCLIFAILKCGFQSKFIVWVCLCVFMALLASHLDGELDCNYWVVATPIWIWKGLAILGALLANIGLLANDKFREELKGMPLYKSMMISVGLYLLLLIFEYLTINNLESDQEDRLPWEAVFSPLILTSLASIASSIWAFKHDISCELEVLCSVNLLQFIFIALRLDEHITGSWEIVLIPTWTLVCIIMLAVLFTITMALVVKYKVAAPDMQRSFRNTAIAYSSVVLPPIISLILLACKLNGKTSTSFSAAVSPIYFSYIALIVIPWKKKKANQWWFDLKDMWQFMLKGENVSQPIPNDEEGMLDECPKLTSPDHPDTGSHCAVEVEKVVGSGSDHDAEAVAVVPPE